MSAAALIADCQKRLDRLRGSGGWFTSGGSSIDHGTYRSVIGQYHDRVYYEGRVAWGALVQANEGLYTRGDWDSTGALVYSFDRHFDANPNQLERIAASVGALKKAMPKDPLLVAFAAEVRNDTPREIDRMVPVALTQGRQVRYETVYIQRHRLPTGYLAGQFFPIIISTSQPTQPMVLPLDAWTPELVELWNAAGRKQPASQPIQRQQQPISRQPQAYDDGYGGTTYSPSAAASGAPGGGMSGGAGHGGGNQGGNLQFSNNAANRAGGANYGGTQPRYDNSQSYGNGAGQSSGNSYGGSTSGSNGSASGYGVSSGQPSVPHVAATNAYAGQVAYSGQAYSAPPPAPAPAPAPRLDPAAEAFAQKPLQLTSAAAGSLKLSAGQQSAGRLKVRVSVADNLHRLDLVSGEPNPSTDFVYDSGGVTLVVDVASARNLTGVEVDFGSTPHGIGFIFRRAA
jgi:Fe-S cluster assembly iron-binding protein IscA